MGQKMTITDRKTLIDIIIDELEKANSKKITSERLTELAKLQANKSLNPGLVQHTNLRADKKRIQKRIDTLTEEISDKIHNIIGKDGYIGYCDTYENHPALVHHFEKELRKQYKLKVMPDPYDIEKEIVKAGNTDYKSLIKSITKIFT